MAKATSGTSGSGLQPSDGELLQRPQPVGRSLSEFRPLRPAEEELLTACKKGLQATVTAKRPLRKSRRNCIRAEFLRFLALGGDGEGPVHERGVQLGGAYIEGFVDLSHCKEILPLAAVDCRFTDAPSFSNSTLMSLVLTGTKLPGLDAQSMHCLGWVFLDNGFHSTAEVRMLGGTIDGSLACADSLMDNGRGLALSCDQLTVRGSVFLRNGFRAVGEVRFLGASMGGNLDCTGCTIVRPKRPALSCDQVRIGGSAFLRHGFSCEGELRLIGAQIGGSLDCSNGSFSNVGSNALMCDNATIKGSVFLRDGFAALGAVRLQNARIAGVLAMLDCDLHNPGKVALIGDGVEVAGAIHLQGGFRADGEVRLMSAKAANLHCSGGVFRNPAGDSLSCDGIEIGGNVFLNDGFKALGTVRLVGAAIGRSLEASGGHFNGNGGWALLCDQMTVGGSVFFNRGFVARGTVRLPGAQIAGSLDCAGGRFRGQSGEGALSADAATVERHFFFRDGVRAAGTVSLTGMSVGALCDDETSWQAPLVLDGFRYGRIDSGPTGADARIRWLGLQNPEAHDAAFWPQPWEHLVRVLREMGHVEDARLVAMEKQRAMRRGKVIGNRRTRFNSGGLLAIADSARIGIINRFARILHLIYGAVAGYGYRPLRTLGCMFLLWLFAAGIYYWAESEDLFLARSSIVQGTARPGAAEQAGKSTARAAATDLVAPRYSTFSPAMYSLDVILPLVDLKQEADWAPAVERADGTTIWPGFWVRALIWTQILLGWVASLLLVSAVGRLVQKE